MKTCKVWPEARRQAQRACSVGLLIAGIAAGLACVPARAATDEWQWSGTLYLWLPSLSGETALPPDGGGPAVDVNIEDVLDISGVFMGALEARHGRWGLATDVVYLDLAASKSASRQFPGFPSATEADLDFGLKGWLWSVSGSYALGSQDARALAALAGVRMLDLETSLDFGLTGPTLPPPGVTGSASAKQTQWDAIVGFKGRELLGASKHWFVPWYVDVGTGESDFTWQSMVGLGYSFGTVEVLGAWRYLDYDLGRNAPVESMSLNGPAFGVTVRF